MTAVYPLHDGRYRSETLHRCAWCGEWGRPAMSVCSKCGEWFIPVPNTGPPPVRD